MIDARGKIVMPGFIDTHHHQAWTAIRSSIPDSILIDDGTDTPSAAQNYFANVLAGPDGRPGSPATTGRRTCTSASCSAASRSSTTASPRSTTFRRSTTRRSTRTPPSRGLFDTGRRGVLGLFRKRRQRCRQPVSERRVSHQTALVLVERPTRAHDHGRRGLSRTSRPTPSHGRSGASSDFRSRRTSSRRSASARSWTTSPTSTGPTTLRSGPTTCSST